MPGPGGAHRSPLQFRVKLCGCRRRFPEIVYLASLVGGGRENLLLKRGTLRRKEKRLEEDVSCCPCLLPIWPPAVPRGLRPATQDGWTLALPPACHTRAAPLEPCPPITSPDSVPALENQLRLFGPLGTRDTPSGTAEDTQVPATRGRETQPRSGTHTCTARYSEPQSHTNRFTPDTHRDTQVHTS